MIFESSWFKHFRISKPFKPLPPKYYYLIRWFLLLLRDWLTIDNLDKINVWIFSWQYLHKDLQHYLQILCNYSNQNRSYDPFRLKHWKVSRRELFLPLVIQRNFPTLCCSFGEMHFNRWFINHCVCLHTPRWRQQPQMCYDIETPRWESSMFGLWEDYMFP